jgi:hypothetical protein
MGVVLMINIPSIIKQVFIDWMDSGNFERNASV